MWCPFLIFSPLPLKHPESTTALTVLFPILMGKSMLGGRLHSASLFYTITYILHSAYVSSEPCAARISPPSSQFVLWTENDFAADAEDSHIKHFFFFLLPLGILLKIQVDSVQKYDIILNMFFFLQFCLL